MIKIQIGIHLQLTFDLSKLFYPCYLTWAPVLHFHSATCSLLHSLMYLTPLPDPVPTSLDIFDSFSLFGFSITSQYYLETLFLKYVQSSNLVAQLLSILDKNCELNLLKS